ncbi:ABC transporter substrate-binding protein [Falsirhodobacter xinxiangensis]|uniref:ABC transporter substrate-binding protein n=1 Tax=Falsirhodobacter xinxiangensis TaxID=2530049 RepID=UPI001C70857B|nr:ABC transporter substrate-binding protein [Rhodobacter xinxiangensis]
MSDLEMAPPLSPRDLARMQGMAARGATRRDILRGLVAGGMTIAAASMMSTRIAHAQDAVPVRGGTLKVAGSSSSTAETLDPARFGNGTDYARGFMFYNTLTALDGDLAAQPELATEWSTADGIAWVFRLREGVRFHDGRPFTSADAVFSIARHNVAETASRGKTYTAMISEVRATGPHELAITLTGPNYDLPVILGTFNMFIVPDGSTEFGIGTGPYKLEMFEAGVRSVAVRNDDYWKDGKQHVDSIEYFGLPDESSRLNALRAGEVHLTTGINPRSTRLIEREEGVDLFVTKSGTYSDLIMQRTDSTTGNPDFILGMKHLLQREVMVSSIYRDFAEMANDQPIASTMKYHDASAPQREHDPEKAKFHLEKAGVIGADIPLVASAGVANTLDMALIIQQAAAGIGVNINVQRVPVDGYWSNVWMKVPFGFGTITQRPTADMILSLCYKSGGAFNSSRWQSEAFDKLLDTTRAETNEATRAQNYADLQQMVRDEAGTGIPLFFANIDAHSSKLKGLKPIPTGNMMGYSFAEHVWLEA